MEISLPPRIDGQPSPVVTLSRQITLIGANGSGKSRFCNQLMNIMGDRAFRVSALKAMFGTDENEKPRPGSVAAIFERYRHAMVHITNTASTEFDRLSYIMLVEEFHELMAYKTRLLMGDDVKFPHTKLDTMVRVWQEVFPKNKILREKGQLLFTNEGSSDKYSSLRLSDGEKAVFYYIGAVQYAPRDCMIVVDDPETFIHRSMMQTLWNAIEELRPDCTFVYNTHDVEFAASRVDNQLIWIKAFDPENAAWDYEVMASSQHIADGLYLDLLGGRKPVLFIEGDDVHSIDSRLYPLIFPEYTVRPLGSCDKVIESVRTFNDLRTFHHLDSRGIVDRDRRSEPEVEYLRKKSILVPNVAEIENMLMLEGVVRAVATSRRRNSNEVFGKVCAAVFGLFKRELKNQALEHVRHRVKRLVEKRIDMKFRNIGALENHMVDLVEEINPHGIYEDMCRDFHNYVNNRDYSSVLRVFNYKKMIGESNVATLCGMKSKDEYIRAVLNLLKQQDSPLAKQIRNAIKASLGVTDEDMPAAAPTPTTTSTPASTPAPAPTSTPAPTQNDQPPAESAD